MDIKIEGWKPTPLEQSLMDGTFDKQLDERKISEALATIPQDLLEVQSFEDAMADLKREAETWK